MLNNRTFLFCGLLAAMLAGCKSQEDFVNERAEFAISYFDKIDKMVPDAGRVYTLPECIAAALESNLDLKVNQINEQVAKERKTAEALGMLPDLYISNGTTYRDNQPGSTSINVRTDEQSLAASRSSEKFENSLRLEMALSLLDFGLAYVNFAQAQDRELLAQYQTRRAAQNLALEVAQTYYKVAVAQQAIEDTEALLERCRNVQAELEKLGLDKKISPFRMFDESQRFIQLEKRLVAYQRSYENSCTELRALMGYKPTAVIRVDAGNLDNINPVQLPAIAELEKLALYQRPELYQLDINANITVNEGRKALLMMLPNVRMFVDFNNSSNPLLYNQSWWEIGVRAAYNLLKLPQQMKRYQAIGQEEEMLKAQLLALSVGVLSQVRIAVTNVGEAENRYRINKRVYDSYSRYREAAIQAHTLTGSLSQLELDRVELETAEAKIDCLIELGNYYVSYYRLLNMVGMSELSNETLQQMNDRLQEAMRRMEDKTAGEALASPAPALAAVIPTEPDVEEPAPKTESADRSIVCGKVMRLKEPLDNCRYVLASSFAEKLRVLCVLRGEEAAFADALGEQLLVEGELAEDPKFKVPVMTAMQWKALPADNVVRRQEYRPDPNRQEAIAGKLIRLRDNRLNLKYALAEEQPEGRRIVGYLANTADDCGDYLGKEVEIRGAARLIEDWGVPIVGMEAMKVRN